MPDSVCRIVSEGGVCRVVFSIYCYIVIVSVEVTTNSINNIDVFVLRDRGGGGGRQRKNNCKKCIM